MPKGKAATPCLEWTGARSKGGYGQTYRDGKVVYVHREVWEAAYGSLRPGEYVCHHCDNPPCFAIDHLFVGSQKDNMRDAAVKGRCNNPTLTSERSHSMIERAKALGRLGGSHKLTDAEVAEVRTLRAAGLTQAQIADRFGVGQPTISNILNGRVGYARR